MRFSGITEFEEFKDVKRLVDDGKTEGDKILNLELCQAICNVIHDYWQAGIETKRLQRCITKAMILSETLSYSIWKGRRGDGVVTLTYA